MHFQNQHKKLKVLKFDLLYPEEYFKQVQKENQNAIEKMNLHQYIDWIHEQKMGYGEVITKEFKREGWEVLDYYFQDIVYFNKVKEHSGIRLTPFDIFSAKKRRAYYHATLKDVFSAFTDKFTRDWILGEAYAWRFIEYYKPDIIFIREPIGMSNLMFEGLKKKYFIVSLVGCNIVGLKNWRMDFSNLIFTLFPEYKNYFNAHAIDSELFEYGAVELLPYKGAKNHDVTFIGVLGTHVQFEKTKLFETIAEKYDFKWWGIKGDLIDKFPNLKRTWQGYAAGVKMFEIYQQSKIVLNDYPFNAKGGASNIRIKEVMSAGSMLLTRFSRDLEQSQLSGALATFNDAEECLNKIQYYLDNESEREAIASKGYQLSLNELSGRQTMKPIIAKIKEKYEASK